jgi:outer membrane protein assembly factor BamB
MGLVMQRCLVLTACLWCFATPAPAGGPALDPLDHWPQWRGPLATGAAPRADPPVTWDEKTNVRWKVAVPGKGSATPIIWGDLVFVVTAEDTGRAADPNDRPKVDPRIEEKRKTKAPTTYQRFLVLALDRKTGKVRWQHTAAEKVPHEGIQPTHSYAAASPTTDGRRLYVSFGSYGVYCYDLQGKLLWQRDLGPLYTRYGWGEGSSPVVHGDTLLLLRDHEGPSSLVALDAATGQTRWQVERDEPTSWSTPLVVEHKGQAQVIVNATNRVRSYDLATGKLLWQCGGQTPLAIPSPVAADGLVFCMSGYGDSACFALPLDATGDLTGTKQIAWQLKRGTPYVPSPLLYDGRLYFTLANNPLLSCVEARTGKVVYGLERLQALGTLYASPAAAAGRVYIVDREGTTLVLKAGAQFEVLASNSLSEPIDASPAFAGRQLFLRSHHHVYCLEAN